MARLADGAIVGSAIVRIVGAQGAQAAGSVGDYVRAMAEAVHGA
jgi:tryptophan synthase alpha chain